MQKKILRSFSYLSPYLEELSTFNRKVNLKQTIAEKRNLQRFLENQVKDGKLRSTIQRTTQYDNDFSKFLKEYQEKHRDSPNILDLSHYTRDNESFNKNFESRKEELIMLEEFRKRRDSRFKKSIKLSSTDQRKLFEEEEGEEAKEDVDENENSDEEFDVEAAEKAEGQDWSAAKRLGDYTFNKDEFVILMLKQDTTTLVTKLNRINHFRTLIFAGNGNGVIGYGKGKGNDFEEALKSAETNLKRNLIAIPLDHFCPLSNEIRSSYYGFELRLLPRIAGMNAWGSPIIAHMLLLSGITNVKFKCIFRNMNPYAMVLAYFKAVTSIRTPKEISETMGVKVYRESWGKPVQMDKVHTPDNLLISEYFGPDHQKPLDIPFLDEGKFTKLYTAEKRLQEILHDNEIVRNPGLFKKKKTLEKKRVYGSNYQRYLDSNVNEEIKGIRGKTAYIYKNLADEEHPNNYRFKDEVDYSVPIENEKIIKKLNSLNYLEKMDQIRTVEFEYLATAANDHEGLHKPLYPVMKNYVDELKPNEIIVQNLPLDAHINDIVELFEKYGKISDIKVFTCVLNLPAFAKISFEKNDSVVTAQQELHWKIWKEALLCIKTKMDSPYEESWNRTLCVLNIPSDMTEIKLLEILSDYGRVMHYELPKEVENPNLPTKEDLLEYLEENPEYDINGNKKNISVKIVNHILDKGVVETYYIPKSEEKEDEEEKEKEEKDEKDEKKEKKEKKEFDIQSVLENQDSIPLSLRFLQRQTYHTSEWSEDFLFPEEKRKAQLLATRYERIFGPSKFSSQTEKEFSLSNKDSSSLSKYLSKYDKISSDFHKIWAKNPQISSKQKKIVRESYENKRLINKGYCFVTFSSTDQAKLVLLRLNRAREASSLESPLYATLKEDLEHYELDNEFIFSRLKQIKTKYVEYLSQFKESGENSKGKKEETMKASQQYLDDLIEKKDVRKTLDDLLKKELFNEEENATIASLKPSQNYDKLSIGRQNSLSISKNDVLRLKGFIDGSLEENIQELKEASKTENALLTEYISPLNERDMAKDQIELKRAILKHAETLYFEKFTEEERMSIGEVVSERFEDVLYDPKKAGLINPSLTLSEIFIIAGIREKKYLELMDENPNNWSALLKSPVELAYSQEITPKANKDNLMKESARKERFIRFLKYLQMLLVGKFDVKSLEMFDQEGVPLDQGEILIKFSKDASGNEYLPYSEKARVMEYLRPENEEEKLKILSYEEEKAKFWQQLPQQAKNQIAEQATGSIPLQALFEHEMGIPEKMFKPTLKPGQTKEQLVKDLNKEAELGVEYMIINERPHGEVVIKVVKPAYKINISKMEGVDFDKLKKMAEKEIRQKEGKIHQKDVDQKMKAMWENMQSGMGTMDDEMLGRRDVKQAIEVLMKETPFSRAEIESILKTDVRDQDVLNELQKQFYIERMKEAKKALKPEDLIKYNLPRGFSHLKRKSNDGYYTTRFKKI